ncbi:hypothetical protein [Engelhardtia mirabilis]|uniref:Uncharacterized protein n=1 Tax=Engelhardtia mirabilis TaxID=2528011 RepID=A0A518BE48_9BACT|nr:hypothetical protein Pla133_02170 [Planctomycetes bacterium Pla133]QDU99479.1 hypothetical protein Pla86_02170 [Planctomycetes bacterium Pla86]
MNLAVFNRVISHFVVGAFALFFLAIAPPPILLDAVGSPARANREQARGDRDSASGRESKPVEMTVFDIARSRASWLTGVVPWNDFVRGLPTASGSSSPAGGRNAAATVLSAALFLPVVVVVGLIISAVTSAIVMGVRLCGYAIQPVFGRAYRKLKGESVGTGVSLLFTGTSLLAGSLVLALALTTVSVAFGCIGAQELASAAYWSGAWTDSALVALAVLGLVWIGMRRWLGSASGKSVSPSGEPIWVMLVERHLGGRDVKLREPTSLIGSWVTAAMFFNLLGWLRARGLFLSFGQVLARRADSGDGPRERFQSDYDWARTPCVEYHRRIETAVESSDGAVARPWRFLEYLTTDDLDGMALSIFMRSGQDRTVSRWIRLRGVFRTGRDVGLVLLIWGLAVQIDANERLVGAGEPILVQWIGSLAMLAGYLTLVLSKRTQLIAARMVGRGALLSMLRRAHHSPAAP